MIGFAILIGYAAVLALVYYYLKRRRRLDSRSVKNMIFASGSVKASTLIFSVFAAWMWTTSIFGSAEAFSLYGIWGPLGYVIGACIAFGIFIPILSRIMRLAPGAATYLSFLQSRYSKRVKLFYYIFAFAVSAYVLIEQAVGIAYVLEQLFGSPFKWVAFLSVMIAVVFVALGGMKSLLLSEKITAILLFAGFGIMALLFFQGQGGLAIGLSRPIPRGGWLQGAVLIPAGRYFIMAIVIGFSQLVFDPAYYIKAKLAKDKRQMKIAFFVGGILLWGSITLVSSMYLGWLSVQLKQEVTAIFTGISAVIFTVLIVFIGISTVAHYLMGMLGIFTVDYYKSMLKPEATEREMIVFGRLMVIVIGVFCALIAISLEDISLLTIDVFCAIFFAAPCGPLIVGLFSGKRCGNWPIIATALGTVCGILIWVGAPAANQWDQFLGTSTSLLLPLLIMIPVNLLERS